MSHKNYNKMYNAPSATVEEFADQVIDPEIQLPTAEVMQMSIPEVAEPEVTDETATEAIAESVIAVVVDCLKLNVRAEPSPTSKVVATIDASTEVAVYDSVGNYYKICTASGIEGYCVKDYLNIK